LCQVVDLSVKNDHFFRRDSASAWAIVADHARCLGSDEKNMIEPRES
jgi:hypothetical protein